MITYHYEKQLAFSPAYTFVFCGYAEMLKEKLTHPCLDWGNQSEVVYAKDSETGKIVCAQLFDVDKLGRAFTKFAYTLPEYRGQGIATKVFEEVEKRLIARGVIVVYTSAVAENDKIHRVFEKTGRTTFASRAAKWYRGQEQL
jgi:GNAT superfamily N-acetyltransferase